MFTVEQRDAYRERVLRLAQEDERVVAGAEVGSLSVGRGDRFSDLDLFFGVADAPIGEVLDDFTARLVADLDAVRLVDLEHAPRLFRVFLLPDALQLDLSLTPASSFRAAGPKFQLLFGETAAREPAGGEGAAAALGIFIPTPPVASDVFGWGVVYALHSRSCIERGRWWQAEHYVDAVRDHALSLACLHHGVQAVEARGYDDLPAETLARLAGARVGALEREPLRAALAAGTRALLHEGSAAGVPGATVVADRLAELC
jgi:hypothetical protein